MTTGGMQIAWRHLDDRNSSPWRFHPEGVRCGHLQVGFQSREEKVQTVAQVWRFEYCSSPPGLLFKRVTANPRSPSFRPRKLLLSDLSFSEFAFTDSPPSTVRYFLRTLTRPARHPPPRLESIH